MSYRDDQFFRFTDGRLKPDTALGDNPPFMYPGNSRHRLDTLTGSDRIKRGFIKSLLSDSEIFAKLSEGSANPIDSSYFGKRMFFQFNPQLITHSVRASSSSSLPFLQDPGQLTQPSMGETNFSFDIMLDRQMEMNQKHAYESFAPGTGPGGTPGLWDNDTPYIDTNRDPKDIGVFADLKVLYQIIGQGLNAEQVALYKSLQDRSSARSTEDSETSQDSAATTTTPATVDLTDTFADLNINAGNNAFLATLPIRVVFSSLFMVDGFVTSTDVVFTKFNTNMVPIQARVAISMQAIYLGFAREKTVLSEALKNAELYVETGGPDDDGTTTSPITNKEDYAKLTEFETRYLSKFKITAKNFGQGGWDEAPVSRRSAQKSEGDEITKGLMGAEKFAIMCGFPLLPKSTNESDSKYDPIYKYIKDGNSFSITYSFTVSMYRKAVTESEKVAVSNTGDRLGLKMCSFTVSPKSEKEMGNKDVATTYTEWNSVRRMVLRDVKNYQRDDDAVKIQYHLDGSDERRPNNLFLSTSDYAKLVSQQGKITIAIDFFMQISLGAAAGPTTRTYNPPKIIKEVPIEGSFLNVTFPTVTSFIGREKD